MKTRRFLLVAGLVLAVAFTFSCSSDDGDGGGSSSSVGNDQPSSSSAGDNGDGGSVAYEGQTYRTVKIGTQTWMAENLNYAVEGSKCYDDSNCNIYGRLYNWETAKTVCPSGWHLPTREEWEVMTNYIGGTSIEGSKLKAVRGWNNNGNGTDDYGFSALPGGFGSSDGISYVGDGGFWWSASEDDSDYAYSRRMYYNIEDAGWRRTSKSLLFSVRCLQD
jgi:uncharacterized protein (TIGR02145 family)